ncbi:hypothetical protein TELCIR_19172 [Teladorsagia circumcincta]|uniref:Uncharacterized protein n=1 Tax=Teladorsagia circumcincta TaxID=45464 RepID=A0A2G9TN16_TELCI|nr:hypothetical protein TELCIR_19172 [Teladorsagia circumcincta]
MPSGKVECFYVPILKSEYKAMEFSYTASTSRVMTNVDASDRLLAQIRVVRNIDRSIAEQNFERVNWYGTLNTLSFLLQRRHRFYLSEVYSPRTQELASFYAVGKREQTFRWPTN